MASRSIFQSLSKSNKLSQPLFSVASKSLFQPTGLPRLSLGAQRFGSTKVEDLNIVDTPLPKHKINPWEGSIHWYGERALSVALIPMLGYGGLYGGHPVNDMLLGIALPIHIHIGLSAVITDYLPYHRLPIINRVVTLTQLVLTGATFYGCYVLNTQDEGITEYIKKIWKA